MGSDRSVERRWRRRTDHAAHPQQTARRVLSSPSELAGSRQRARRLVGADEIQGERPCEQLDAMGCGLRLPGALARWRRGALAVKQHGEQIGARNTVYQAV